MPRRRILFLVHSASRTGAPLLVRDIAGLLQKDRFECAFVLAEDGPLRNDFEKIGDVQILPLYPDGPKYFREFPLAANRIGMLRRFKPDLIYCNTIHPVKWIPYAHLLRIPVVTHVHELSHSFAALGPAEYRLLKQSDSIIAVSHAVSDYLNRTHGIQSEKIVIIHAGIIPHTAVKRDEMLRRRFAAPDEFLIGLVGRVTPMKGSDMLPQLLGLIAMQGATRGSETKRIRFVLIASTDDRESFDALHSELSRSGLSDLVSIVTNVPDPVPYYACMDALLMLSREDPFPLVVLEAMNARLPIVAFSTGGIPEAVDSTCGVLIQPFDIEAMAQALLALASDSSECTTLGECGSHKVTEKFDLRKNVSAIAAHLDQMLTPKQ